MESRNKTKRIVIGGAAAVGLMLGAAGVANAVSGPDNATSQSSITPTQDPATVEPTDALESENEADDSDDDDNETPEEEAAEEAAEQELLNSFPVSPDQASEAALAVVPGTVDEVEIEDDGPDPVFEVEIIDANGQEIEVTVDPNTGAVIDQMAEADEGPEDEANEGPEADEGPDGSEAPATN